MKVYGINEYEILILWTGNRDIVGFGMNGDPGYYDHGMLPFPAIRWKENTDEVLALREKEKCDWKTLSLEDKKACKSLCFHFARIENDLI